MPQRCHLSHGNGRIYRAAHQLDPVINATIGEIDVDKTPLTEIVKYRKQASLLVDKVGFDQ